MAYLTASDLAVLLPVQSGGSPMLTASSNPNMVDANVICGQVSAELDAAAAKAGYIVPVGTAATGAYAQLAMYTRWGAGYQILALMSQYGKDTPALAKDYRTAYENALKMLRDGTVLLVGAGQDAGETARALPRSYYVTNPGSVVGPQVTMDGSW